MCGIAGFTVGNRRPENARGILQKMTDSIRHRGPDAEGHFVDEHVALGHRRLSIIDLESGAQPMAFDGGRLWIVFNGEIYNFPQLKLDLEKKGYRFTTRSDTEVLLALYDDAGDAMPAMLNGMFSFALWDSKRRRMFGARDRMGQKPFYYSVCGGEFSFASEPKALLKHPDVSRQIDLVALSKYLAYEYVPVPMSIYRDIRKVPGGNAWSFERGEFKTWPFWECRFSGNDYHESMADTAVTLRELLETSVSRHLLSDVPVGVFLSGGIDSSAVVALMSQFLPSENIKTFSIGFQEKSFDESSYSSLIAKKFNTDHHHEVLSADKARTILPEVLDLLDEPFADPSILPTYLLSRFTREHVKVALGGDGGDELFAGYPTFLAHRLAKLYDHVVPGFAQRFIRRGAELLPVSSRNISLDFKIKRFLSGIPYPDGQRDFVWVSALTPEFQEQLWAGSQAPCDGADAIYSEIRELQSHVSGADSLTQTLYLYYRLYLQEDILAKVDRASMMNSLEVRAPFLDTEFVDFANQLPSHMKLHRTQGKHILKQALRNLLPDEILFRPKKGFGIPVSKWFRYDMADEIKRIFHPDKIRREGFFDPVFISRLVGEHLAGKKEHRKALWTLYIFENWLERWQS